MLMYSNDGNFRRYLIVGVNSGSFGMMEKVWILEVVKIGLGFG